MPSRELLEPLGLDDVGLVEHQYPRCLVGADLHEHILDRRGHHRQILRRRRRVDHVQDQLREPRLLERRPERVDELMRELADEPDGVGQQVVAPPDAQHPRRRVQGLEERVAHAHVGAGEGVQERRLACVRVPGNRHGGQMSLCPLGAHHRAARADVGEPAPKRRDPVARQPAVGLDLGLARSPRADSAAEALQVRPQAAHPRKVVLELRQLDLQLAVRGVGVPREDVENHRGAVDHRHPERRLEVAFLARGQLVVAGDEIRVGRGQLRLQLLELARAEVGVGMRMLAPLNELADDRRAGGVQELAELRELFLLVVCKHRDRECALSRAAARRATVGGLV